MRTHQTAELRLSELKLENGRYIYLFVFFSCSLRVFSICSVQLSFTCVFIFNAVIIQGHFRVFLFSIPNNCIFGIPSYSSLNMSALLADIDATCAALGYNDGNAYHPEADALQGLKVYINKTDLK